MTPGSLPGQDGVVGAPGSAALDVVEAGGGQERAVLGRGPLAALGLHEHVERVELCGQGPPPTRIHEPLNDHDAAAWNGETGP